MIRIVALVFLVMQAGQGQDMLAQVAVAADLPLCRHQATRLIMARESSLQEAAAAVGTKATAVPMVAGLLAPARSAHSAKSPVHLLIAAQLEPKEARKWLVERVVEPTLPILVGAGTGAGDKVARPVAPKAEEEEGDTMGVAGARKLEGPAVRIMPRITRSSSGMPKVLHTRCTISAGRISAAMAMRPSLSCRRTTFQFPRRHQQQCLRHGPLQGPPP